MKLNGINSIMLSRISGKSIPQEARPITTSHNIVRDKIQIPGKHPPVGHKSIGLPCRDSQSSIRQIKGGVS